MDGFIIGSLGNLRRRNQLDDLLTELEHEVINTAGRLMSLFVKMAGENPHQPDLDEVCSRIHDLQHTAMAQAAARAFPDKYRLFGQVKGWVKQND